MSSHRHLMSIMRRLRDDYEPYGQQGRQGFDCSCGCRWYKPLAGALGSDWGVCANRDSHRAGLLTFEHQGCMQFEAR